MNEKIKNFLVFIKSDFMNNKKGLELSINFIVIIIISLIVFFFGARFIYQLGSEATQLQSMTVEELDRKIGSLACEGSEKVCFGFDKKIIKRGKLGIFSLRIINILDSQDFDVIVTRPSTPGYTKQGDPIPSDNLIVKPASRTAYIKENGERNLAIGVEVPKNAVSGTYIFDVAICYDDLDGTNNDPTGKCGYDLYSFNKLYVEVS